MSYFEENIYYLLSDVRIWSNKRESSRQIFMQQLKTYEKRMWQGSLVVCE